jgi:tetratricopeptide (TPR) repeat protein
LNDVAQGYITCKMWSEAVQTIKDALKEVTSDHVISSLNKKLVDCYERLNMFDKAFDVAVKMFFDKNSHELYLRARGFAVKIGDLDTFIDRMEKHIQSNKRYDSVYTLLRILSFEGHTNKLIDLALKSDSYSRHDYLKYTSKSLVFRALNSKDIVLLDLKEFLQSIEEYKIDGIVDMIKTSADFENEQFLLDNAVGVLKEMVQFHINAAQRSRYTRAAYYCVVIKDIYTYMNEKDEFNKYYGKILMENNRRPALKDEMKKKMN